MRIFILLIASIFTSLSVRAQADSLKRKVFVSSGLGFGFPVGDINTVLSPRISNSVGMNIPMKDERFFLYPVVDFMTFGYDQNVRDPDYQFTVQNGSANIIGFSLMPGLNQFLGSLRLYAFVGPHAQLVYEPRLIIDLEGQSGTIDDEVYLTGGLRGGLGAHYKLGSFYLFLESGLIQNFTKMQNQQFFVVHAHGGLKTDITQLTDKIGNLF
jgi:hypothetical protein